MVHVIGIRDAQVRIEPVLLRQRFGMMSQVPLSKTSRRIALTLQMVGDRMFGRIEPLGRGGKQNVLMHSDAFGG